MLQNALSLLVACVHNNLPRPDLPMSFYHVGRQGSWQIIVQRIPEKEAQAA